MEITRITFDTDDGRTFELEGKEELDMLFNSPNEDHRILLGLAFTPNLSGGFRWKLLNYPSEFLSPYAALADVRRQQFQTAMNRLRREIDKREEGE